MAKFRKKPVVIEAWPVKELLSAAAHNWKALPKQVMDAYEAGDVLFARNAVHIRTLEGEMKGESEDYLICGVKGEFYPCKPDIFEATYEPVSAG